MKTLKTNLISGVVNTDEEPNETHTGSHANSVDSDETSPLANEEKSTESNIVSSCSSINGANKSRNGNLVDRGDIERVIEKAVDKFEERLKEAEENGFKRALDMARKNPASAGIDTSVPNFLADLRKDMWE